MNLKKMKLATKTSLAIAASLTVLLTVLIVTSILSVSREMTKTIDGEFSTMANENGIIVQGIIDTATSTAQNFEDYLINSYADYDAQWAQGAQAALTTEQSMVYDAAVSKVTHEAEAYLLGNAWSTLNSNPDIYGIGVMFEPRAFEETIPDYAIYITRENAKTRTVQQYGLYADYSAQDFYRQAATTQKPYFTNPFPYQDITMVTASFPIVYQGETLGVVMVDITVSNFSKLKSTDAKYPTMAAFVLTQDTTIAYYSLSEDVIGTRMQENMSPDEYSHMVANMDAGAPFQMRTNYAGLTLAEYFYPIRAGEGTWWAVTYLEPSDLNKSVVNLSVMMAGLSAVILALIIATVVFLLRRLLRPIDGVVKAAEQIAQGNLSIQVTATSEDEIGILANAFGEMSGRLKVIIEEVGYILGEMAQGNFRLVTQHEETYVGDYRGILLAMREINRSLSHTLTEIDTAAGQVSVGSEQVSDGAQALSQGAAEQASSVEELSASLMEISQRTQTNAENATLAGRLSGETGAGVQESNRHMEELMSAMGQIADASSEIGKIIKTIDDIAFQTNILALNASVEAARAGAAGKGFAVVADEVRSLAGKSAAAAKNTAQLIEEAIRAVDAGKRTATLTADSLLAVVEKSRTTDRTIQQIAAASEEQAMAISQITAGVEQISAVVQTNSATSEESAAASEELSSQAQLLKDLVGRFQLREDGAAAPTLGAAAPQRAPARAPAMTGKY